MGYLQTPDGLALAVIQSLNRWADEGRPGARKTSHQPPISSYQKRLLALRQFLISPLLFKVAKSTSMRWIPFLKTDSQSVCMLCGRGGIGKSKLLYDWTAFVNDGA